jgi:hypothetical protein
MEFDWVDGALTVERAKGITYFVRYHTDPNYMPGDVEFTCAVVVKANGEYEVNIFGGRMMTGLEITRLYDYFASLGYTTGVWHRYKNGKKHKTVLIKGRHGLKNLRW